MKKSELRKMIKEELLKEGLSSTEVKTAYDLVKAISKTSHKPNSLPIEFVVGSKTYSKAVVFESDSGVLIINPRE